jgi:hypothetical protein
MVGKWKMQTVMPYAETSCPILAGSWLMIMRVEFWGSDEKLDKPSVWDARVIYDRARTQQTVLSSIYFFDHLLFELRDIKL